jgi:hypothetical protein
LPSTISLVLNNKNACKQEKQIRKRMEELLIRRRKELLKELQLVALLASIATKEVGLSKSGQLNKCKPE